ncbi:MAG: metal-dependent transcriptional regulator [Erysipelotrichaceae bacterium]|nr:metal-dependent transcriptional regulator [Erysipelotrichaceae bacterium]MBO4538090.1 metal-dependent transcriptional regulator [Erysipelotrichaceae bacterium]MBR5049601.1 metal-dependent transcriptional regulator [Erysipelotrichaceae bacterium]
MRLQESGEMYLETILILSQKREHVRAIDVCEEMNYSKPSVSRGLKILRENSYVAIDRNGYITLTRTGREVAEKIYERHRVLTEVLIRLGVDPQVAAEDACRMEHVISDASFESIKNHLK